MVEPSSLDYKVAKLDKIYSKDPHDSENVE